MFQLKLKIRIYCEKCSERIKKCKRKNIAIPRGKTGMKLTSTSKVYFRRVL